MKSRLMYIESKPDGVRGPGRIGRVASSQTGKTLYYDGRELAPLNGRGLKTNYFDTRTREEFWISVPRKDGQDSLYPGMVEIDEDARKEYWRDVRGRPEDVTKGSYRSPGKSKRARDAQEKGARRRNMDRRRLPPRVGTDPEPEDTADDESDQGRA